MHQHLSHLPTAHMNSELSESLQELKNFQVFVRVRPFEQSLSSRKSPDRFRSPTNATASNTTQSAISAALTAAAASSAYSTHPSSPIMSKIPDQFSNNNTAAATFSQSINSIIRIDEDASTICVLDPELRSIDKREKIFAFDGVLSESSSNRDTFERAVLPSLNGVLDGFNATVFAYGITGSGKTHTIFGRSLPSTSATTNNAQNNYNPMNAFSTSSTGARNNFRMLNSSNFQNYNPNNRHQQQQQQQQQQLPTEESQILDKGISFQAIEYLLHQIDPKTTTLKFSFLEIYNENVRDLLSTSPIQKNLTIIEDPVSKNIFVQDLKEFTITSISQIEELISEGNQRRALAPTQANQVSSRSHAILFLNVSQRIFDAQTQFDEIITSKLTIIDLAGSEKGTSDKIGKGIQEGSNINKSLLALGNCINILSEKKRVGQHVPYRDSKLTRILKDTLGGNTKTVMIACVSQHQYSLEETINTLNYASRATNIKRKVTRNAYTDMDSKDLLIRDLQSQVAFFKARQLSPSAPNRRHQNSDLLSDSVLLLKHSNQSVSEHIPTNESMLQLLNGGLNATLINSSSSNSEDYLNRICSDLFQNVVESHQLLTSLQEIEENLAQDYEKLLYYENQPSQTPQVQQIIRQLVDSLKENGEIKAKMTNVLETNQEQKANLKFVLLRIANKSQLSTEYEIKIRKQQLEMLDLLEQKGELEKQVISQKSTISEQAKRLNELSNEVFHLQHHLAAASTNSSSTTMPSSSYQKTSKSSAAAAVTAALEAMSATSSGGLRILKTSPDDPTPLKSKNTIASTFGMETPKQQQQQLSHLNSSQQSQSQSRLHRPNNSNHASQSNFISNTLTAPAAAAPSHNNNNNNPITNSEDALRMPHANSFSASHTLTSSAAVLSQVNQQILRMNSLNSNHASNHNSNNNSSSNYQFLHSVSPQQQQQQQQQSNSLTKPLAHSLTPLTKDLLNFENALTPNTKQTNNNNSHNIMSPSMIVHHPRGSGSHPNLVLNGSGSISLRPLNTNNASQQLQQQQQQQLYHSQQQPQSQYTQNQLIASSSSQQSLTNSQHPKAIMLTPTATIEYSSYSTQPQQLTNLNNQLKDSNQQQQSNQLQMQQQYLSNSKNLSESQSQSLPLTFGSCGGVNPAVFMNSNNNQQQQPPQFDQPLIRSQTSSSQLRTQVVKGDSQQLQSQQSYQLVNQQHHHHQQQPQQQQQTLGMLTSPQNVTQSKENQQKRLLSQQHLYPQAQQQFTADIDLKVSQFANAILTAQNIPNQPTQQQQTQQQIQQQSLGSNTLFTRSKSPAGSNTQSSTSSFENQQQLSQSNNIGLLTPQSLSKQVPKREPQSTVIDLFAKRPDLQQSQPLISESQQNHDTKLTSSNSNNNNNNPSASSSSTTSSNSFLQSSILQSFKRPDRQAMSKSGRYDNQQQQEVVFKIDHKALKPNFEGLINFSSTTPTSSNSNNQIPLLNSKQVIEPNPLEAIQQQLLQQTQQQLQQNLPKQQPQSKSTLAGQLSNVSVIDSFQNPMLESRDSDQMSQIKANAPSTFARPQPPSNFMTGNANSNHESFIRVFDEDYNGLTPVVTPPTAPAGNFHHDFMNSSPFNLSNTNQNTNNISNTTNTTTVASTIPNQPTSKGVDHAPTARVNRWRLEDDDSATKMNPLETESEAVSSSHGSSRAGSREHGEYRNESNFVNSPKIEKTLRSISPLNTNVPIKKNHFDFEAELAAGDVVNGGLTGSISRQAQLH